MIRKKISNILMVIGLMCFVVPIVLQKVDKLNQKTILETYEKEIEFVTDSELADCLNEAKRYNQYLYELQENHLYKGEFLDYKEQLNLSKTGMMGQVEIPSIDVKLPIYHGTSEDVLSGGIGHLEGTSLPVGGANTHTILTGHCGLPSAELFTRLDELEIGDTFQVMVCREILQYQVMNIQVVKPEEVGVLAIETNKDLVSLVTCTPYGINTHRLVVTGKRMHVTNDVKEVEGGINEKVCYFTIICASVFLYVGYRGVCRRRGNRS